MNKDEVIDGFCSECGQENIKIFQRWYNKFNKTHYGECIDCCIERKKHESIGKPPLNFLFTSSSTTWKVVDLAEDEKELVAIQSIEYPDIATYIEFSKIWRGIQHGYFAIA